MDTEDNSPEDILPKSNVEKVVGKIVHPKERFNFDALVILLELSYIRANQIKKMADAVAGSRKGRPKKSATNAELEDYKEEIDADFWESVYEPVCIELFLSHLLRKMAENLERDVLHAQTHIRPIQEIQFTDTGEVETFKLKDGT